MNRLEKAAAFGAMMGKRAILLKHADASFFPKQTKDYPGSTADINRRSAEMQAKWAPANAANNLRLQNNEKQRFAGLTSESQNAERQTKRDTYDTNINKQMSQGHGMQSTQSDFANIIPAAQAARWLGNGLYSGTNRLAPAAMRNPATSGFDPMKTIRPDNVSQFRDTFSNSFANSKRGPIKPPTPSMPSSFDPMKTIRPDSNPFANSRLSDPAHDAMHQWGWKFSDKPPVGKPFTKLPNQ